jgi:hypothetical protein
MTLKGAKWEAKIKNQGLKNPEQYPTFEIPRWVRRSRMPPAEVKHGRMT